MTVAGQGHSESRPMRLLRWARELGHLAVLSLKPGTSERFARLYDEVLSVGIVLGEHTLYLNMGYWAANPDGIDAASADLARLVGREARLAPGGGRRGLRLRRSRFPMGN